MSGKSTLLRALGVNVVLAQMGAPVRAAAFTLSPLSVGAAIRVQDSLTDGRSRFFAEITRLKEVVDLTAQRQGAVLFLLDEILSGTNSHDRRIGAEALLTGLVRAGAIGLVTTHDLALGDIATRLARRRRQRALRGPVHGRQDDVRLHPPPRPGPDEQRHRLDARDRARSLSSHGGTEGHRSKATEEPVQKPCLLIGRQLWP